MESYFIKRHFSRGLFWLLVALIAHLIPNIGCTCHNGELLEPSEDDTDPPLTDDLKNLIVRVHNFHRSCVALQNTPVYCTPSEYGTVNQQPGASHMLEMVWDNLLGNMAQDVVNSCHVGSLNQENYTNGHPEFPGSLLGYNTYTSTNNRDKIDQYVDPPVESFLSQWFNENKFYTYHRLRPGECSQKVTTCHYTQMISANTHKIGCGYSYYKRRGNTKYPFVQFFVCFYGPLGNYDNDPPYPKGTPVCKKRFVDSSYPGLCSLKGYKFDDNTFNP